MREFPGASYDAWKTTEDDDLDTEIDDVEYENAQRRADDRDQCVFGNECLHGGPYHRADECFTAEMAVAYYDDADEVQP